MKSKEMAVIPNENIDSWIHMIRGQRVIFDADLAEIYGVPTKALNQAVKRNKERFPSDFMFQLTRAESRDWTRRSLPCPPMPQWRAAHRVGKLWKFKAEEVDCWIKSGKANESLDKVRSDDIQVG